MATGFTQAELDALLDILDQATPPIPNKIDKIEALKVTAMRIAITDKGALINLETKGPASGLYWFNCWAAKEFATAVSLPSDEYGWGKKSFKPQPSDHLRERSEPMLPKPQKFYRSPRSANQAAFL
jgi:hypothetical protein